MCEFLEQKVEKCHWMNGDCGQDDNKSEDQKYIQEIHHEELCKPELKS